MTHSHYFSSLKQEYKFFNQSEFVSDTSDEESSASSALS